MSDNTVPSAREFALNYLRECREEKVSPFDDYNLGMEFKKFTRLHLEAMAKEIAEKARTRTNDESTSIIVDEKTIQKAATDYISKIK